MSQQWWQKGEKAANVRGDLWAYSVEILWVFPTPTGRSHAMIFRFSFTNFRYLLHSSTLIGTGSPRALMRSGRQQPFKTPSAGQFTPREIRRDS